MLFFGKAPAPAELPPPPPPAVMDWIFELIQEHQQWVAVAVAVAAVMLVGMLMRPKKARSIQEQGDRAEHTALGWVWMWLTGTLPTRPYEKTMTRFLVFTDFLGKEKHSAETVTWRNLGVHMSGSTVGGIDFACDASDWRGYTVQKGDIILEVAGKAYKPSQPLASYVGEYPFPEAPKRLCAQCLVRRMVEPAQWPIFSTFCSIVASTSTLMCTPEDESEMSNVIVEMREVHERMEAERNQREQTMGKMGKMDMSSMMGAAMSGGLGGGLGGGMGGMGMGGMGGMGGMQERNAWAGGGGGSGRMVKATAGDDVQDELARLRAENEALKRSLGK